MAKKTGRPKPLTPKAGLSKKYSKGGKLKNKKEA